MNILINVEGNMKKIIISALIILAMGFTFTSAYSAQKLSENVKKAIKYMETGQNGLAVQAVKNFDFYEKKDFINYIKENPDKTVPVFYIIMADEIYKTNKDEAVFWFSFGKLRAVEDVRMCKDESAGQQVAIYGMLARNTVKYMNEKGNQYILEQLEKAVEKDEKTLLRPAPTWACYHGISAFSGKVDTLPQSKFEDIKKETRENYINSMKKHIEEEKNNKK